MGHRPSVRRGNGTGPTAAQARLAEALGWPMELVIATGRGAKQRGLSTHYKIDLADVASRLAIEIDGASHAALERQAQDEKKDAFLRSIGWSVLRFSNEAVMERLEECVRTVVSTTSR
jgi:hypothetical protein